MSVCDFSVSAATEAPVSQSRLRFDALCSAGLGFFATRGGYGGGLGGGGGGSPFITRRLEGGGWGGSTAAGGDYRRARRARIPRGTPRRDMKLFEYRSVRYWSKEINGTLTGGRKK